MKKIKQCIFGLLLLVIATSCENGISIHGNGTEATQPRLVTDFNAVNSSGEFEVYITQGEKSEIEVVAEENILPYIKTAVFANVLHIDIDGIHIIRNQLPMKVYVTTPGLTGVKLSGSGIISTGNFNSDSFEVDVSGSGVITASVNANIVDAGISGSGKIKIIGSAKQTYYSVSGSGNIDTRQLSSELCDAKISGSGNLRIAVEKSIKAKISGSGNIYYVGNPVVNVNISGSGKIINENY